MEISKQKFIAFIAAIVIIIIGVIILDARKGGEEGAFEKPMSVEELSDFLQIEPIDWHNPEKPMPSLPINEKEVPKEAIRIGITAEGFSPSSFEVKKGEEVVLAVTSQDEWVHVFAFKDESLANLAMGVHSGEFKAITFYAPSEPGEYEFFCNVPGHELRGEKGVMIVK